MKLNPDCVRDILFYIEENTTLNKHVLFEPQNTEFQFSKYSSDEIFYHLRQCELSGFFEKTSRDLDGNCYVTYLSPAGHQFLSDIKSDNIWNDVKEIGKKVGSNSLSSLSQIATGIVSAHIKAKLGL